MKFWNWKLWCEIEGKGWKKIYHLNVNQRKNGVAVLKPATVMLKAIVLLEIKNHFIMVKVSTKMNNADILWLNASTAPQLLWQWKTDKTK